MKIVDCKQGTEAWLRARAGIFTASELSDLLTPQWKLRTGKTPETYILRKVAEKCIGSPLEDFGSWAMEQGTILEAEAIPWFELTHDVQVQRVGFVTTDDARFGCSPDGLIGEEGGIEIKCPQPVNHLRYLLNGVPEEYLAQIHGGMYATGRRWWYFLSYSRQFPPYLAKIERDERIMSAIEGAIGAAGATFDSIYERVKAMKDEHDAPVREAALKRQADDEAKARAQNGGELPGEKWLREQAKL